MKRIFGRKEKVPPPSLDQATDKLNTRGDTIDEKIRKLDAELVKHRENIKRTRPGPAQEAAKRRALTVLKQKKLYESQRDQLYNQQYNIEQTSFAIQSMQDSVHTVQAMAVRRVVARGVMTWRGAASGAAGKELKQTMKHKDLRIENIESMQDSMQDLLDMQHEITEALGANYATPDDIDESELMGELDALEDELTMESEAGGSVPAYLQEPDLPAAPTAQAAGAEGTDSFGLPAVPAMPQRT
ncbi:Charged multivesicular body protein 5 [Auxenochlorella protothecoides]|uniref:Charged multivesicular body protein 5 n=1 Tax=Auxenochlorella protothecoides TaxID=3075 RepID=A0A087SK75_AUXPR|nr:Charged multivesicular body protein 5 [Auxenochlorella protothecoides]KFM26129.1 Charged multivesicular body protein 5 [Auxenochlorella protothecoides]